MKPKWQNYWKQCFKAMRSVPLALGVSLFIWLCQLPETPKADYLSSLLFSLMYGLVIYFCISILYALAWAIITQFNLSSKRMLTPWWPIHAVLGISGMTSGLIISRWIIAHIRSEPFNMSGILVSIMIGSFITFMFLYYYSYKQEKEENSKLKAANTESELHVLKNQMQPHFLFNSLNSLSELIETNNDTASGVALKLSDLYREILVNSKRHFVTLDSEVSIIEKYLELEKLRFDERLKFKIHVPTNSDKIYLPPLILQTLVENAVKQGVSPSVEGAVVEVSISPDRSTGYQVKVVNFHQDQDAGKVSSANGTGTGLANTKARLSLLYGPKNNFKFMTLGNSVETSFWFSGDALNV